MLGAYQNGEVRHWQASDRKLIHQVGTQLAIALQQAEQTEQLAQAAEHEKNRRLYRVYYIYSKFIYRGESESENLPLLSRARSW
jgi:methyl-accepting chemotaxis protein PixJ